jgi:5-bromo-4-chloroindolyl phosphate hydrolysis protein
VTSTSRQFLPEFWGGGIFWLVLLVFQNLFLAIFLALGGFSAGLFLTQPSKTMKIEVQGFTQEMLDEELIKRQEQVQQIKFLIQKIKNPEVQRQALKIKTTLEQILDEIRKDPKDLKTARSFLNYYPEAVIKILDRYTDLQSRNINDPSIQNSLSKAEDLLGTITRAFEKQLTQLLQNDVRVLDTELELLRRTIQSKGLGD